MKKLKNKEDINSDNTYKIPFLEPEVTADSEAIELFVNTSKDKFAELYYKYDGYTYYITEKRFDEYDDNYYWCPAMYTASYFDTREKAIAEIMSIIEP